MLRIRRYLVVIEKLDSGYSAYAPDVPGCGSTGATRDEVERNIHEAIEFHLEGLQLEGLAIPDPSSDYAFVEI